MILTCPECATRYQTDAAQFAPDGRKVRCAKCGHVWFQAPPAPEPEPEIVHQVDVHEEVVAHAEPDPEPVVRERSAFAPAATFQQHYEDHEEEADEAPPRRGRFLASLGFAFGWLALAAIVLAIGWVGIRFRQDIATLWPQSASLYRLAGLHVNTRGIEFHDKHAVFEKENGQSVLLITGNLVNITSHELTVPPIRVSLRDDDRHELYHWSFSSSVPTLRPGQHAAFETRLPSPPLGARHIELRFVGSSN